MLADSRKAAQKLTFKYMASARPCFATVVAEINRNRITLGELIPCSFRAVWWLAGLRIAWYRGEVPLVAGSYLVANATDVSER